MRPSLSPKTLSAFFAKYNPDEYIRPPLFSAILTMLRASPNARLNLNESSECGMKHKSITESPFTTIPSVSTGREILVPISEKTLSRLARGITTSAGMNDGPSLFTFIDLNHSSVSWSAISCESSEPPADFITPVSAEDTVSFLDPGYRKLHIYDTG